MGCCAEQDSMPAPYCGPAGTWPEPPALQVPQGAVRHVALKLDCDGVAVQVSPRPVWQQILP